MKLETFVVECPTCKRDVEFRVGDVPELSDQIEDAIDEAENDARGELEGEFEDYVEPDMLVGGQRPFWELSAALRRGDIDEAEAQLDRIAREFGGKVQEEVEQARYSTRARAA